MDSIQYIGGRLDRNADKINKSKHSIKLNKFNKHDRKKPVKSMNTKSRIRRFADGSEIEDREYTKEELKAFEEEKECIKGKDSVVRFKNEKDENTFY
jgi:hypothetical protein